MLLEKFKTSSTMTEGDAHKLVLQDLSREGGYDPQGASYALRLGARRLRNDQRTERRGRFTIISTPTPELASDAVVPTSSSPIYMLLAAAGRPLSRAELKRGYTAIFGKSINTTIDASLNRLLDRGCVRRVSTGVYEKVSSMAELQAKDFFNSSVDNAAATCQ